MTHPFDSDFTVTGKQKERYLRDGFVKLQGFLNADVVGTLLDRVNVESTRGMEVQDRSGSESVFSSKRYGFAADKTGIFELLERPFFRRTLTDLTGRDLFLTFEVSFEIEKNVKKGFPWHVDVRSFGYQFAEEFACSLWVPLHPIDANGQRGGMAYIPQHVLPGDFVYPADIAIVKALKARERAGRRTGVDDYFDLRLGILNSPTMKELLDVHAVEDDFEPGDALLFNKSVIHRSVLLGEGELSHRAAYVMRFVDATSRYDLNRAQSLEFPSEQYGTGPSPYKPSTRQHIEIAEAGAQHGDVISQCTYFSDRDRRTIRGTKDPIS